MDTGTWKATVHGVLRVRHDLPTKLPLQAATHLFASSSLLRIPLPELDSLPPKPFLITALPLGSSKREPTPRKLMPEYLHRQGVG